MNIFQRDLDRKAINDIWVPEKAYLEAIEMEIPKYTPDLIDLEQKEYHNLFVCDNLMKNRREHEYLKGAYRHPIQPFTSAKFSFIQLEVEGGHEFVPLRSGFYLVPFSRIRGELYAVPTQTLLELDKIKKNTVEFERYRANLVVPAQGCLNHVEAFFYLGRLDHWRDTITKGLTYEKTWTDDFKRTFRAARNGTGEFKLIPKNNRRIVPVKEWKAHNKALEYYYYYSRKFEFGDDRAAHTM